MRTRLLAVLSILMLTACTDSTQSLQELRLATPPDDGYQAALVDGYQRFAEAKAARSEWDDSEFLADKGLLAAHGAETLPEDPSTHPLPAASVPEFNDARTRLLEAIEANKTIQPALTAQAVLAYDRWLLSVQNNQSLEDITETHDAFFASLAKLETVHVAQPGLDIPTSEPVGAAPVPVVATLTEKGPVSLPPTVLYFPFNQDKMAKGAEAALHKLATQIIASGATASVNVNGHTDRSGPEVYNIGLSERRARFVLNALVKAGAPAKELHPFGFGESDPAVPTADGVREPRNRRVEVVIEKQ